MLSQVVKDELKAIVGEGRYFDNAGDVGQAVVNVLKKLRLEIEIPAAEDCCGIAAILSGEGDLPPE